MSKWKYYEWLQIGTDKKIQRCKRIERLLYKEIKNLVTEAIGIISAYDLKV